MKMKGVLNSSFILGGGGYAGYSGIDRVCYL